MKKHIITLIFTFISLGLFASGGSYNSTVNFANYLKTARTDYDKIYKILDTARDEISDLGVKAFPKIEKTNKEMTSLGYGIFVIDPLNGKIVISPEKEDLGKQALNSSRINGKAIAREAIQEAKARLEDSPWDRWTEFVGGLYKNYFTRIAITDKGKVYVLAIGKSNIDLQHLFVEKIVVKACKMIKEKGINVALKEFNKTDSIFKFDTNYIYVFHYITDKEVVMIFNPNYPEYVNKNMVNYKNKAGYPVDKILKLKNREKGWFQSTGKLPGETKETPKNVYAKFVKSKGQTYIVCSGVYLMQ